MTSVSPSTPGPLNPGDVVSAALRLYRDRFKMYVKLSIQACLWALVPIYGWAKYGTIMGLMSRLTFQELISQPETAREGHKALKPKLWTFLGAGFLNWLISTAAGIAVSIASAIIGGIVGFVLGYLLGAIAGDTGASIGAVVAALVQVLVYLIGVLWVSARLFLPEVALAVEPPVDAPTSITRSWNLSKGSAVRIQFVVLATYLVMIPVFLVAFAAFGLFMVVAAQVVAAGTQLSSIVITLFVLLLLALLLGGGMLVLPFQQAVKGVLYYDLRSRREGLDLKLTDSTTGDEFI